MLQVLKARGSMLESNFKADLWRDRLKRFRDLNSCQGVLVKGCFKHKSLDFGKVWLMLHVVSLCAVLGVWG